MTVYSERYKYIFFANPQTGSNAIAETLVERVDGKTVHVSTPRAKDGVMIKRRHHASWQAVQDAQVFTREQLDSLLKVTGVRNPWDMLVSRYLKRSEGSVAKNASNPKGQNKVMRLASVEAAQALSFPDWVMSQYSEKAEHTKTHPTMKRYLEHADLVIRFERMQEGFDQFLTRIGVREPIQVLSVNVTDVRKNVSGGEKLKYTTFYDQASRDLVGTLYADVIEKFGYRFE